MNIRGLVSLFLIVGSLGWCRIAASQEVPPTEGVGIPRGRLGLPLGTYMTIEGIKSEAPKSGTYILFVDTLDGKKLEKSVSVPLENVHTLLSGVRYILRGYETGRMIGVPLEVARKESIPLQQAAWQFYRTFVVTSVVEPKDLKVEK